MGVDVSTPPYRGHLEHYRQLLLPPVAPMLRMIQAVDGTGHAQHCPYLTVWRGGFKDGVGKWHTVEVTHGHRADLYAVQRIV